MEWDGREIMRWKRAVGRIAQLDGDQAGFANQKGEQE
jgi:hypothetical protein